MSLAILTEATIEEEVTMPERALRRALTTVAALAACMSGVAALQPVAAQSVRPSTPPPNIDALHATVSGTLIARPLGGPGNLPQACRDRGPDVQGQAMQARGLVICTEEGTLVLLQLSPSTGFFARYWGRISINHLRDGDHINAWGVLQAGGRVLDPTYAVQDTDLQRAFADSQDFIARGGQVLTLAVLQSDGNGPVQGVIHAVLSGRTHVTLCDGQQGSWKDLTAGKTIDITDSLFNRLRMTYLETVNVKVVSCR
ncbi:MAG: hypothetical protein M3Z66_04455 [Chloroflexota bacterium]|nr:hypothetical protein [Chloroflexota bacterium]